MDVTSYIAAQRNEYEHLSIELPGGGEFQQSLQIAKNNLNWRGEYYDSTATDSIIGAFPYDNIVKPIILLEARATAFYVRNINVDPKNQSREARVGAMVASKAIEKYARKPRMDGNRVTTLGTTLKKIPFTRSKQGSVLVKRNKELGPQVVPWENVITDQMDILSGVIIERHYYTPSELSKMRKNGWDSEGIDEAVRGATEIKEPDTELTAKDNITQGHNIEVFELHGEITLDMLKKAKGEEPEDDDEMEFVQAMIVCTVQEGEGEDENGKTEYDGIILYADTEKESPYMLDSRYEQTGRALGESVYESLKQHQKWHNYSKTEEVRMMTIAGKIFFKTNQPDAMTNVFNGKIAQGTVLKLGNDANGQPNFFDQVNTVPTGTPVYQNMREEWADSARLTTSSHAAKMGEEAKSGTPFRAQYLQNIEASSQFEHFRKEMGEHLIRPMIKKWVLPDAIKELLEEDEIYTSFTAQELLLIDEVITERAGIRKIVDASLNKKVVLNEEVELAKMDASKELRKQGNKRSLKDIKKFIKNVEGDVVLNVTDEMRNKSVLFESYANLLNTLAPEDPRRDAVIDMVMDAMGKTKEEVALYAEQQPAPMEAGNQGGTPQNAQMELEQLVREKQPTAAAA